MRTPRNAPVKSSDWMEKVPKTSSQWLITRDNEFREEGSTVEFLPSDFYSFGYDWHEDENLGYVTVSKMDIKVDDLVNVPGGIAESIVEEIDDFWKTKERYEKFGLLHYRGYLLYGPHGGGKTGIVYLVCNELIKQGGIVFVCTSIGDFMQGIKVFRRIEPDRKVICVFEDLDAQIKRGYESQILSFLDGESKIDGALNIASSNYPELLDGRLVNRPRRFDRVIKIGYPDRKTREYYFQSKNLTKTEVDKFTKASEGLSFAALAETVVSVKVLGQKLDEVIERLKEMQRQKASSEEEQNKMGLAPNNEDE